MPTFNLPLFLEAALLGAVEGLTEFIPVSSTGHLLVLGSLMGFEGPPGKVFEIVIQLGAVLAVCWLYRARLWRMATRFAVDATERRLAVNIVVATIPALALGFFFASFIKEELFKPVVVAVSWVAGGVLILVIERLAPPPRVASIDAITPFLALKIGLCQCVAIVPGTSRSGATIMGALLLGLDRRAATEFSFFLAMPVLAAATTYDIFKSWRVLTAENAAVIAIGFAVAFVTALVVVRGLVAFVSRHGFAPFAWYRIAIGLAVLAWLALR
jgi:undecaprenyl-diphosphatase